MRLEPKPAAALGAAAFALLLIFGAAWPGPGFWLLGAALTGLAAAAAVWWLDAAPAQRAAAPAQRERRGRSVGESVSPSARP